MIEDMVMTIDGREIRTDLYEHEDDSGYFDGKLSDMQFLKEKNRFIVEFTCVKGTKEGVLGGLTWGSVTNDRDDHGVLQIDWVYKRVSQIKRPERVKKEKKKEIREKYF